MAVKRLLSEILGGPLLGLAMVVACGIADAATITWKNAAGGSWQVAANWDPETVPGSGDDVVIPAFDGIKVT